MNPKDKISHIMIPSFSLILLILGTSFFMSFVSIVGSEGGSFIIALFQATYYAGLFSGAFMTERSIRRVGHIRVYAATASLTIAVVILMGLNRSYELWSAARFVMGFCMAAQYIIIESWLLTLSTKLDRGRILAIYIAALSLGQAASQYILDFITIQGTEAFLIAAFFVALSVIPITTTSKQQPHVPDLSRYTLRELLKASPFGMSGCLISGILLAAVYSFTPAYALFYKLPIATIMAATILGGFVLQWPFGKASDFFDRRKILFGLTVAAAPASILMIQVSDQLYWAIGLSFVIGGILCTLYPLSVSQVCDRVGQEDLTGVTALLLVVYGIGSVAGPILASFFWTEFGPTGLFIFYATASGILACIGLVTLIIHKSVGMEEQQDFVALSHLTPVAYDLDPRQEEET